jgi:hypothetical protein
MAGDELVVLVVIVSMVGALQHILLEWWIWDYWGSGFSFWLLSLLLECAGCELYMQGSLGASQIVDEELATPELIDWWQIE